MRRRAVANGSRATIQVVKITVEKAGLCRRGLPPVQEVDARDPHVGEADRAVVHAVEADLGGLYGVDVC